MVQIINDPYRKGNRSANLGNAIGQSLADAIPKEVERYRLSAGLQNLSKEGGNLSPEEYLAKAFGIPGITPEMARQIGEFARQKSKGNALKDLQGQKNQPKPSPFPQPQPNETGEPQKGKAPSITKEEPFAKFQEGYIPPTKDQELADAGKRYNDNPALFNNDPQQAIDYVAAQTQRDKEIAESFKEKHKDLTSIQDNVVKRLQEHSDKLGVQIPANVYSKIEDKAIQATKPKKDHGQGLTEQEAIKEFGEELDKISRDYKSAETIGTAKVFTKSAQGNKDAIRSLREKFKKNDDLENFRDLLRAKNGLSASKASYMTYPVSENKTLNNTLEKLPILEKKVNFKKGFPEMEVPKEYLEQKTLEASNEILKSFDKNTSPLAVSEELKSRGYDPNIFMREIDKKRSELKLAEWQGRELDIPRDFTNTINDLWMFYFSGLDKLVEE
jgi:hypothetical protein